MAYELYLADLMLGCNMTDLISGRKPGRIKHDSICRGFSNSDVLGLQKGWAGAFRYIRLQGGPCTFL
jgi:phosphoribosylformylglycinamidine synthase